MPFTIGIGAQSWAPHGPVYRRSDLETDEYSNTDSSLRYQYEDPDCFSRSSIEGRPEALLMRRGAIEKEEEHINAMLMYSRAESRSNEDDPAFAELVEDGL